MSIVLPPTAVKTVHRNQKYSETIQQMHHESLHLSTCLFISAADLKGGSKLTQTPQCLKQVSQYALLTA